MISRQTFANLNTPQAWRLFCHAVGILFGIALSWVILAGILSLFNAWFIVALTLVLGSVLLVRTRQRQRRAMWIDGGRCGQCGYDLRATPRICPECGRDASLDEPLLLQVRRSFAQKRAAEAKKPVEFISSSVVAAAPPPLQLANVVLRRREVDSEPIPLEPLTTEEPSMIGISTDASVSADANQSPPSG